jgi:predicted nucleotidyltransferase
MISGAPIQDPGLQRVVSRLVADLRPRAIILFGSRARGSADRDSDYDLLVISDEVRDYGEVYRPIVGCGVPCDVVPCSAEAWRESESDAGGVLRDARDEGIVLYGQP